MLGNYDYLSQIVCFVRRASTDSGVILPIYTDKENWPTICGSEQEIAIKKYYNLQTIYMKLKISCEIFANSFSTSMVPSEAVTSAGLYFTVQPTVHLYSGPAPILQNSTHPHLLTRPLAEMVARMRGRGGWRLLAPAPTSGG